jgi:hypothetical protein
MLNLTKTDAYGENLRIKEIKKTGKCANISRYVKAINR